MDIYLIRHGRQDSRLCNVDVGLSKEGVKQAHLVGERIKGYGIEALYSSTLLRALQTADIINTYLDVPKYEDSRLRESDFGDMTGLSTQNLKEKYHDFLSKRSKMEEDVRYPGGGENSEDVFKRAFSALLDIVDKGYKKVCIVTHGGVIRALFTGIVGAAPQKWLIYGRQLENCSISEIMYDTDTKTYHIERLNDYAHLEHDDSLLRKHFGTGFFKV